MDRTRHITFDLETLSRTKDAPIVQIAAIEFNLNGDVLDRFNALISEKSLHQYGFQCGMDCVFWWLTETSEQAKQNVFGRPEVRINIKQALFEFKQWYETKTPKDCAVWSHCTFDPPILDHASKKVGMSENIIHYRNHFDIRTLQLITGLPRPTVNNNLLHDAMYDCEYQAKYVSEMLTSLAPSTTQYHPFDKGY